MIFRQIKSEDSAEFLRLLISLDNESKFMLYEPDERNMTVEETEMMLKGIIASGSYAVGCFSDNQLVGFATLRRGFAKRNNHSGYVVIGVMKTSSSKGYGTSLIDEIEKWAVENEITRLELTVMKHNKRALELYLRSGYEIEGTKKNSLIIDGEYVDEYYMSKVLIV